MFFFIKKKKGYSKSNTFGGDDQIFAVVVVVLNAFVEKDFILREDTGKKLVLLLSFLTFFLIWIKNEKVQKVFFFGQTFEEM